MKTLKTIKGLGQILLVFVVGLAFVSVAGMIFGATGAIFADGGAGTVVDDTLTTEKITDAHSGLLLDDIDEVVTKMWPA